MMETETTCAALLGVRFRILLDRMDKANGMTVLPSTRGRHFSEGILETFGICMKVKALEIAI